MTASRLDWYARRLSKMTPREMAWRLHDEAFQRAWARRQVRPGAGSELRPATDGTTTTATVAHPAALTMPRLAAGLVTPEFTAVLPPSARQRFAPEVVAGLSRAASKLLAGSWEVLGVERSDLASPDWFFDPVTATRAPQASYSFDIDHRSEEVTGNVKQIWELSRLHHLTLLSAASYAGAAGADDTAELVAGQLRSWWAANPFLSGVNWTSGIEVGIRLISFVWTRRLLDGWDGAADLFEHNPAALAQIAWHQEYLAAFQSRGSSANNHVIAEAAGQLVASLAFPWFEDSYRWATRSAALLEAELRSNTFQSGLNREQASSYHALVAELGLLAAAEAEMAGRPLSAETWELLVAVLDAGVAVLDEAGRPPRQGDGDDGRGLVVDPPETGHWPTLVATGAALFGPAPWWQQAAPTAMSTLVAALVGRSVATGARPPVRPFHFPDAGCTILRTADPTRPEIWCRCDAGPHGFLSIAAHAHADALSVEVRHGGVDVLADPGTYCYHGEPQWRRYFRSTMGHNTIEIGGEDQSVSGGPFLWLQAAGTTPGVLGDDPDNGRRSWSASHDGYERLSPPARHRRTVVLDDSRRRLEILDEVSSGGSHRLRMAFHLGPDVRAELDGALARLSWSPARPVPAAPGAGTSGDATTATTPPGAGTATGTTVDGARMVTARLELPPGLAWAIHRGEDDPVAGWYSPVFGRKEPAIVLIGNGSSHAGTTEMRTTLRFET